jgi:hypothetical protein
MRIGVVSAMVFMAAVVARADSDTAFILRSSDGSTQMIGSLEDLRHVRRAFHHDNDVILWTRIEGEEYVVSDPAILARAREIFHRSDGLDERQQALENDVRRHEAEEEALDERQELLDAEQDRLSEAMTRELETLVRDALRSGKATRP